MMTSFDLGTKANFDHKMSTLEGRKGLKLELKYSILASFS